MDTSKSILQSLVFSEPLILDLPEAPNFSCKQLQLPEKPTKLNLQQKLGHLYEDALAILLNSSTKLDLLEKNLPLRTDIHTTVGELDFLLQDRENHQLIHLELATKFYLAIENNDTLLLPGPDARDNYFKKLNRLRTHQLTLLDRFQNYLPAPYRDEKIQTQQIVHGCIFDHIHAKKPATPEFISPNCRRGKWLHHHEIKDHFPDSNTFHIIPKHLWPASIDILSQIPLETWNPNETNDRCTMIRANDAPIPYFIAPNQYPNQIN